MVLVIRTAILRSPTPCICYCYCQGIVFDWSSYANHLSSKLIWQFSSHGALQLFQLLCSAKYKFKYSENLQWVTKSSWKYCIYFLVIVIRQWKKSWLDLDYQSDSRCIRVIWLKYIKCWKNVPKLIRLF